MISKTLFFFMLLFGLGFFPFKCTAQDEEGQGPGKFYYLQYEQEPWRQPNSPALLLHKSLGLMVFGGITAGYLLRQKRKG